MTQNMNKVKKVSLMDQLVNISSEMHTCKAKNTMGGIILGIWIQDVGLGQNAKSIGHDAEGKE